MMQIESRSGAEGAVIFCIFFAAGIAMAVLFGHAGAVPSTDAVARAGICADLLEGLTEGRQGLIGSLRWAPLPSLLAMPFLRLPVSNPGPFAMIIVAAAAYALLAAFLNGWWVGRGLTSRLRIPAILAMYLSPVATVHIISGSSDAVFVMLIVMVVCFFLDWWEKEDLRSLAYLSLLLGLGIVTRFQFAFVFAVTLFAVFVHLLFARRGWSYAEGTLAIFCLPAVYLVALWFMANWLIMGEATFFLRGLWADEWGVRELMTDGCDWKATVLPLGLALIGWISAKAAPRRLMAGLPAVAVGLLFFFAPVTPMDTQIDKIHRLAVQLESLESLDRVSISGYSGYMLESVASPRVNEMTIHSLSIYIDQTLEKTLGRRLYILAPPATPEYRWEDMRLKYPGLYYARPNWAVFERRLHVHGDEWRLLGVARPEQKRTAFSRWPTP